MKGSFSPISDLILGMLGLAGVSFFLAKAFDLPTGFWLITFAFYLGQSVLILRHWRWRADFGWANRATLLRSVLVLALVGWAPFLGDHSSSATSPAL
ncbi:MAG: hypothetical protein NZ728_08895, partial [Oleiphilaceae bacterium]|nr:hypothetical protein [Oleiphilaceae bacterium]